MDFWTSLAVNVLLQVIANRREAPKWLSAFAKVYVKIEALAQSNPALVAEIEHQRKKEGLL